MSEMVRLYLVKRSYQEGDESKILGILLEPVQVSSPDNRVALLCTRIPLIS